MNCIITSTSKSKVVSVVFSHLNLIVTITCVEYLLTRKSTISVTKNDNVIISCLSWFILFISILGVTILIPIAFVTITIVTEYNSNFLVIALHVVVCSYDILSTFSSKHLVCIRFV